jgi:chromosome segregation ATPase
VDFFNSMANKVYFHVTTHETVKFKLSPACPLSSLFALVPTAAASDFVMVKESGEIIPLDPERTPDSYDMELGEDHVVTIHQHSSLLTKLSRGLQETVAGIEQRLLDCQRNHNATADELLTLKKAHAAKVLETDSKASELLGVKNENRLLRDRLTTQAQQLSLFQSRARELEAELTASNDMLRAEREENSLQAAKMDQLSNEIDELRTSAAEAAASRAQRETKAEAALRSQAALLRYTSQRLYDAQVTAAATVQVSTEDSRLELSLLECNQALARLQKENNSLRRKLNAYVQPT